MRGLQLFFIAALALVASCAQQVSPKGGPKDVTAPQVVSSQPENGATNYGGNRIELEFDEFVQLRNINDALIISPPLAKNPSTKLKSKTLVIEWEDTLRANTTYIFNLGNGVQDITENNPLDSNVFVFSTGPVLDSLTVNGRVKNAFDLTPPENAWVMLYENGTDSAPLVDRPGYLGRVEKNGAFSIGFVKPGSFKVVALTDLNNNYLYDLPDEQFAFLDEPVVSDSLPFVELSMFTAKPEELYVSKAQMVSYGKLQVVFNQPVENPGVRDISGKMQGDWYYPEHYPVGDTLICWIPNNDTGDTLELEFTQRGKAVDTTRVVLLKPGEKPRVRGKGQQTEFELSFTNNVKAGRISPYKKLVLSASHPLAETSTETWQLLADSVAVPFKASMPDGVKRKIALEAQWKSTKNYLLMVPPGSITDVFGLTNDTLLISFGVLSKEDFGNFSLKLQLPEDAPQYVLQLLDKAGKPMRTDVVSESRTVRYPNLLPGSYGLKLVYDANANGQWDTGNYRQNQQPEKVVFFSGKIDIRAGWDQEIDWVLTAPEAIRK